MINKVLIANRGEIALRVIKTCKKLGIKTVTIYSQDDSSLPHANEGDENICLGSGSLAQTYLNQEKIIELAKKTQSDAIHPGYGFLSENALFCEKVSSNNIIFIGPSVQAINLMGDKTESKIKMEELGIPLIKGFHGENQDPAFLKEQAVNIGFPVLIKASAGGGGKGMRIVHQVSEFDEALKSSKREALNAFSNDNVLIEKYIVNPRHIEVQLVSDGKGNHFHFFERECSIQRRYQKIIEESPSIALTQSLREEICETALKISRGINYLGAGTIEFILSQDNKFYFLEMNTRLQVEHPVTEKVTGVDLVELQILAANGDAFDFKQSDITQTGHAIECRIYAEDPDNEFLPTIGKIQQIQAEATVNFRLDCGYYPGNNISLNYDPMLAKVIVHDFDRISCIEKMNLAMDDVLFGGTKTNRDYLKRILSNDLYIEGDIHTHFVQDEAKSLELKQGTDIQTAVTIAAAFIAKTSAVKNLWDLNFNKTNKEIILNGDTVSITLNSLCRDHISFDYDFKTYQFNTVFFSKTSLVLEAYGEIYRVHLFPFSPSGDYQVFVNEFESIIKVLPKAKRANSLNVISEGALQSPMPGKVFKVLLNEGDTVKTGDSVLIVEAMKMEHAIKATKDGVISKIFFKEGAQVQGGVLLCEIE